MAKRKGKTLPFNRLSSLVYFLLVFVGIVIGFVFTQNRIPDISVAENITLRNAVNGKDYKLVQTSLALQAKLDGIEGNAVIDAHGGKIKINVDLKNLILPENTNLQAYLVDSGLNGGPGKASISDLDEKFGRFYNNLSYKKNQDLAPFVQPLGILANEEGRLTLTFSLPNSNFLSYDAVIVTLESLDLKNEDQDPRPGPVILSSDIKP